MNVQPGVATWVGLKRPVYGSGQIMCAGCCAFAPVGNDGSRKCPKEIAASRSLVTLVEAGGRYHLKVVILCLMTHKHPTGCPLSLNFVLNIPAFFLILLKNSFSFPPFLVHARI